MVHITDEGPADGGWDQPPHSLINFFTFPPNPGYIVSPVPLPMQSHASASPLQPREMERSR